MKISLLTGAYKNAGDFLIVKRCKELLNYVYPICEIKEYKRCIKLDDKIDEINESDILVIAGGPAYVQNLYPDVMPLMDRLDDIKIPLFAMAMGWKGADGETQTIYGYNFSEKTKSLLDRIKKDGFLMGCRDLLSERVLNYNGYDKTIMTGCAAWYNISYKGQKIGGGDRICVSEPANSRNFKQFLLLIDFIKNKYPISEIIAVFHRGISADKLTSDIEGAKREKLKELITKMGIEVLDISYGSDGFAIYDTCRLHIGYRVHAHIYNLSCRKYSILIEEDGRGEGVDEVLGLKGMRTYYNGFYAAKNKYVKQLCKHMPNNIKNLFLELDDYLNFLEKTDYVIFKWAFERMEYYFQNMIVHLKTLEERIN